MNALSRLQIFLGQALSDTAGVAEELDDDVEHLLGHKKCQPQLHPSPSVHELGPQRLH